jgi:hypothetical protein
MKLGYRSALMSAALLVLGSTMAWSDTGFIAHLDGPTESPPVPTPATGTCIMVLNNAQTELSYTLTFSGLLAPQTAAHFHHDDVGNLSPNGPIVRGIGVGSPISGVWKNTDAQPLTPFLVGELFAGRLYVNVHTTLYPAGEIKGYVLQEPTPTRNTTWARIKALVQ